MSALTDGSLVALARAGSQEAFVQLVTRHERAMVAIARSYFASEADVEDAVQEAFVKAYQSLPQLEADDRFTAWLARITITTCLLSPIFSRSDRVFLGAFASTVQLHPRLGQAEFTFATLASKGERSDFVKAALGRLHEEQRVVLMLRFGEGMTYKEIADYLDLSLSTVRGLLYRAKQAMKKAFKILELT